jgi:peptidoglycan hydrolase-like protein with peptidoglycan-binding domain
LSDPQVVNAQKYVNSFTDSQIPTVAENGLTSWAMMYALTRILQRQIGIGTLSDNFGPGTLAALQSNHPLIGANTPTNVIKTVQAAFYCKGYDGANIDGSFSNIEVAVGKLKSDMGFNASTSGVGLTPKMVKGLMTMDPFVLIAGGDPNVRAVQQWMNARYITRADFFVIPCDGHFSRDVQRALMFAIQYQIGMADGVANGFFGPGTQNGIRSNPLSVGSSGTWVQLFSAALIFNKRSGASFTSTFSSSLAAVTSAFQSFSKLPVTSIGDFQTWASLLVSTGDPARPGTACDCVTEVTAERATALKAAGYQVVGRYLSNVPNTSLNKKIQDGELSTIASNGLSVFPIYQTFGGSADYFNEAQGVADAFAAIERTRHYGFWPGTRIYFAVDFDALDYQIVDNVIPHFRGIKRVIAAYAPEYAIGIYGPRNACSKVAEAALSTASFVSDMSTGFSGNLGFSLPQDWSFDQIATISVGSGSGFIEIDKNISSGLDTGQNTFNSPPPGRQDVGFDSAQRNALLAEIQAYLESVGIPEFGGDGVDEDVWTLGYNTTTEALDKVLQFDTQMTAYAQTFGMRKAIAQALLLKEYREYNALDPIADNEVRSYYGGMGGLKDDSSTGIAQIFAHTSIAAHNYCIDANIISEARKADVWDEWQKLNESEPYSVEMLPRVVIHAASMAGAGRPNLTFSEDSTRRTLARFNGTGVDAVAYGDQVLGIFKIFEKYNAFIRSV